MTLKQEEALFNFLEDTAKPFTLDAVTRHVRRVDFRRNHHLAQEIARCIDSRKIAFPLEERLWVSRRGCFESASFAIRPTRMELLNGVLIPGHRCIPFANPDLAPQEYSFYWKGAPVAATTSEGAPEELYPYYSILGEEYAPQFVARDNPENEEAYNQDFYEDPSEVSIKTFDMRGIYRECAFIPGDRFVVKTRDWKKGVFVLEKAGQEQWSADSLHEWFEAAEAGFADSFDKLGPGASTEEQIAFAYWYGGKRMREVPAYSLEEFLYEKTSRIDITDYGIESRFWYAGQEIPDRYGLDLSQARPDKTCIEQSLWERNIPISEYVFHAYVWDALFRRDSRLDHLMRRIIPESVGMPVREYRSIADYAMKALREFSKYYNPFTDKTLGPIRQRVGELHTAVIDLSARLMKGDIEVTCLPKHTFVVLSQIQNHAAGVLEDMALDGLGLEKEAEAVDTALDHMIETYEDIKELINEAIDDYRRSKFRIVRGDSRAADSGERLVQISIGGAEVWRRVMVSETCRLTELHEVIQAALGWKNSGPWRFTAERVMEGERQKVLEPEARVGELIDGGVTELAYEYGAVWIVKVILLADSCGFGGKGGGLRCVEGGNAAPPETVEGPLRFKRFLLALTGSNEAEKALAEKELGADFRPDFFDIEACNRSLSAVKIAGERAGAARGGGSGG
ncbi:MAG: plasmid pRiA4b ORF-3 family protein [Treponematales bacterium]